ncbi:MAG TPA: AGE family epimerase/isomerase [Opitutaceae bacterium]|nr:AGE family epimerase/isomerase [Opitutaceae bacterium]
MHWSSKSLALLTLSLSATVLVGPLMAEKAPRGVPTITVPANDAAWRESIEQELRGNILPFWIKHTVDHERGGFYGEITNDLKVDKNAVRGALLTSRILWTYSSAYSRYKDPAYLEMAKWAYDDLIKVYWDNEYGGLYWTASADGKPMRRDKQIYGQVFGVYALSEYYRVTHDQAALDKAIQIYRLVEEHAKDPVNGGYFEGCSREWKREGAKARNVTGGKGTKTQNTHIHILEAYTNLLRAWPDEGLKKSHRDLIEVLITKIVDPKTHHLILFLSDDFKPQGTDISYGHDIEFSWLLTEAADVQGDAALKERAKAVALDIAAVTLAEGVDTDGSLFYESEPGGKTDEHREWWPQAESAVGFYNAYQLSGDDKYRQTAMREWGYIEAFMVDHKNGEWFRARTKAGKVVNREAKVSLWKCPYHNGRSCLELLERLEKTSAAR